MLAATVLSRFPIEVDNLASAACPKRSTRVQRSALDPKIYVRSYKKDILEPAGKLRSKGIEVEVIANIPLGNGKQSAPILKMEWRAPEFERKPWILLTAGIHGDEPAGVKALFEFMEHDLEKFKNQYNFLVIPCVNPSGYILNTRNNLRGQNINRRFNANSESVEAAAVLSSIQAPGRKYAMCIDCHEDNPDIPPDMCNGSVVQDSKQSEPLPTPQNWNQQAYKFYTYETARDDRHRLAHGVVETLKQNKIEIWTMSPVYDDVNNDGVISYGPKSRYRNHATDGIRDLDTFINSFTAVVLTMETPTGWAIGERVRTHRLAINTALSLRLAQIKEDEFE